MSRDGGARNPRAAGPVLRRLGAAGSPPAPDEPAALRSDVGSLSAAERRAIVQDSLIVTLGGQVCRALGTVSSLALRRLLAPEVIGIWTALRVLLDNTSRTSLGVPMAAVREVPILLARRQRAAARRVCDVTFTWNTVTSSVYGLALLGTAGVWWAHRRGPLDRWWAAGMAVMAGLVILKRYQDFLIAVLRARKQFGVCSRVSVAEAAATLVAVVAGAAVWGFGGMMAGWVVVLASNILLLHRLSPVRFRPRWDRAIVLRLLRDGLPMVLSVLALSVLQAADRLLIIRGLAGAESSLGYYSVALLATSWPRDLTGRIGDVMLPRYQEALGRTGDPAAVARLCGRMAHLTAGPLAGCFGLVFLGGPALLGWLLPQYRPGLPALRSLIPGVFFLELSLPARHFLLTTNRLPRLLGALVLAGAVALGAGSWSIRRGWGIAGVAGGMSTAYVVLFAAATVAAGRSQGRRWGELALDGARLLRVPAGLALAAWIIRSSVPGGDGDGVAAGLRVVLFGLAALAAVGWTIGWPWRSAAAGTGGEPWIIRSRP